MQSLLWTGSIAGFFLLLSRRENHLYYGQIRMRENNTSESDPGIGTPGYRNHTGEQRTYGRNLTVQANIRLVNKRLSEERIRELLAAVDLEEAWDKKAGELSGGMCRRTAIARALAADRNCILMDEPLSGLDPDTRIKALDTIKKYTKGKTLLLVTHEKQDAFSLGADKILEM